MSFPRWVCVVALTSACTVSPPHVGKDFEVAAGLEMTVWATEPLVINPTNFDIDERGRIWFVESVNYRSDLKSQPWKDEAGDRIVIVEDTDGDGRADSRKVFDQHPGMLAPLGISVLGSKVVVSQSPDLMVYTKDEDDRIISKETLLSGWGGIDHDHGLHVVLFGHDGRYYFNSGDQGFQLTDRSGNSFASSRDGPYYAATVQSVRPDGTDFRVLAHNARNPYEIAFDSYGSIWQTDNDDDGNQWTRLLYVMEGANFGYWGPGGRRWREDRGTHFHEERPDTIPYVARTGPGSPTGLILYEGELLPVHYRNQLLHTEPGKRLVQTFRIEPDGAGYRTVPENTVISTDPMFRPSDLAVAPDGSVFIADWQDPVVGGHNMLDIEQGRIFRLAPIGHPSSVPQLDLATDEGLLAAFASPNQATRYRAYQELMLAGEADRLRLLLRAWNVGGETLRARSLWMLAGLGPEGRRVLEEAFRANDPRMRILALRVARIHGLDFLGRLDELSVDPDAQVRREAALMLQSLDVEDKVDRWVRLANGYDGSDRWYLSALGIAASGAKDAIFQTLHASHRGWDRRLGHLYRTLQAPASLPFLARLVRNRSRPVEDRIEALDALAWQPSRVAALAVADVVGNASEVTEIRTRGLYFLGKQLFSVWSDLRRHPLVLRAVSNALRDSQTRSAALELAELLADPVMESELRRIASGDLAEEEERVVALRTLGKIGGQDVEDLLRDQITSGPARLRMAAIEGLWAGSPDDLGEVFRALIVSDAPNEVRSLAVRTLGRRPDGQHLILDMEESLEMPAEMRAVAISVVHNSRNRDVRARAQEILPAPTSRNERPVVRVRQIVEAVGSAERGRTVYHQSDGANCVKCHSLSIGEEIVGPSLAAIASKYGKEGMLNAILHPSDGIAPEYTSWILDTSTHGLLTGILIEDTLDRIVLRTEAADEIHLAPSDILEKRKGNLSIMPEDLVSAMTQQELVDLLEFLSTLGGES